MTRVTKFALALLGFTALVPGFLCAQRFNRPLPDYIDNSAPDQAKGREVLEQFRKMGIAGDYYLRMYLRVMPKKGAEYTLRGQIWGTRNDKGPLTRVSLTADADGGATETRLLIQNGLTPGVWRWNSVQPDKVEQLTPADWLLPIPRTDFTPFDLQMPFLYWTDFTYEGLTRIRGRFSHRFLMYPPADFARQGAKLTGVRMYLDTQFNALVQVEMIGDAGRVEKTVSMQELKKIDDQWIVKSVDIMNGLSRNKTRFGISAAALKMGFLPQVFEPAELGRAITAPADELLTKISQ